MADEASHGREEQQPIEAYGYQHLSDNQSIRMLTLQPGQPNDPLRGELNFVNVKSAGVYEPLSYVWGNPSAEHTILIGTTTTTVAKLKITTSLYRALRRLRLPDRPRRLWADQICINQMDKTERSEQVKFMNIIYKNASHVLVWLGVDDENLAEPAFHLIHKLDEAFGDNGQQPQKLNGEYLKDLEDQIRKERSALDSLTDLPWFTRGWIVQEIGTKAPATMFWGEHEIDWVVLHRVCERLTDYHHLRSKLDIRTANIKYVFQRFVHPDPKSYHANRFNFIYELHRARGLHLTDKRDRIFAWLGHYSIQTHNQQLAALKADYTKSVSEIYIDVAKKSLMGGQDEATGSALITLAAVQHMSLPSTTTNETGLRSEGGAVVRRQLPTWVPDWNTYQSFILSEPIIPHRAHGTSSPKLDIIGNDSVLKIYGVKFDTVIKCSRSLKAKEFHATPVRGETELAIEYLWHKICDKGQFNLDEPYPNGQEALFALMQALSNGCVQIAGRENKAYHEIPRTRWLEQHTMYLAKVLDPGSLCPALLGLAEKMKGEHEGELWSRAANGASKNRKFARTVKGYYVLGPKVMEEGDVICVLFGGKLPFCLRPWKDQYLLVGECYVHGLMDGEAMRMLNQSTLFEEIFEVI